MTDASPLWAAFEQLPADLQEPVQLALERARDNGLLPENPQLLGELPGVWAASDFVSRVCSRSPALLVELHASGDLDEPYPESGYRERLAARLEGVADSETLHRQLRRLREREMLRIAWRDLSGRAANRSR